MKTGDLVIFYDGECGFCNRTVAFVLRNNPGRNICFAPIQSVFTQEKFKFHGWKIPDLNTFYFLEKGKLHDRSTAALHLIKYLRFRFKVLGIFWLIPVRLRDRLYDFVAKRRQHISRGYCVMPGAEDKARFYK